MKAMLFVLLFLTSCVHDDVFFMKTNGEIVGCYPGQRLDSTLLILAKPDKYDPDANNGYRNCLEAARLNGWQRVDGNGVIVGDGDGGSVDTAIDNESREKLEKEAARLREEIRKSREKREP